MMLTFSPMDEQTADEIISWCYEPPYDIYNLEDSGESIQYTLDPRNNFYAMRDEGGHLIGFCSFGLDGRVPGGDYAQPALDIGMGLLPDLIGQGFGSDAVAAVLDFARGQFQPMVFRVTIAAFNQRAQRVWEKYDFRPVQRFIHKESKQEFVVMVSDSAIQRFGGSIPS